MCSWEILKIMNAGGGRFGFVWGYSAAQRKTERKRYEAVSEVGLSLSLYLL